MGTIILITFILICYGISNMVVFSNGPWDIFKKWRDISENIGEKFGELFSCMMCFPFYVGVFVSIINILVTPNIPITPMNYIYNNAYLNLTNSIIIIFFDGFIASGTSWVIHNIEEYFEK